MIEIASAQDGKSLECLIELSQEYVRWMMSEIRERYPELDTKEFLSEHSYEDVRKKFPGEHVPPDGCLLIALNEDQACGCIALGRLTDDICEVRTLYVRPAARGAGAGRKLVEATLDQARKFGYSYARLDTLAFMESAFKLYRAFGFHEIEPYLELSAGLKQYIRFLEMKLT